MAYFSSILSKDPYKKGFEDSLMESITEGKAETVTKLLTKKFGEIPKDIVDTITTANISQLNSVMDSIFDIASFEEVLRLLTSNETEV